MKSIVIRKTRDRPARTSVRTSSTVVVQRAVRTPNARVRVGVRVGASGVTGGDGSTTVLRFDVRASWTVRVVVAPVRWIDRSMDSRMLALVALAFKLDGWSDDVERCVGTDGRVECLGVILLLQVVKAIARLPRDPTSNGGRERRIIRARRDRCRPSAASGPARESPRSRPSSRRRPKSTPNRSASRSPRPRSGAPCTVKPSLARSRLRRA